MLPRIRIALAAVVLAAAATPVAADWYVGAGVAGSEAKDGCNGVPAGVSCDETDIAAKLFAGYRFGRSFAVEGGYTDLGKLRFWGPGGKVELEASGYELTALGITPLGPRWWIYGKVGAFFWDLQVRDGTGVVGDFGESGTELTSGFGAGYAFTKNVAARIEYQVYTGIGDPHTTGTCNFMTLGGSLLLSF